MTGIFVAKHNRSNLPLLCKSFRPLLFNKKRQQPDVVDTSISHKLIITCQYYILLLIIICRLPIADTFFPVDECRYNNGGCTQICVDTYDSYYCTCRPGYRLAVNDYTCPAGTAIFISVVVVRGQYKLQHS